MGQHAYVNRPVGDPLAIDFIATTRTLNSTSRLLGVERMRLGATILALEMIQKETKVLEEGGKDGTAVKDLAGYQLNASQNLVLRTEYAEKRVQSQIAVVRVPPLVVHPLGIGTARSIDCLRSTLLRENADTNRSTNSWPKKTPK
jgi:hypothetical protein